MKSIFLYAGILLAVFGILSCKDGKEEVKALYTCPMPKDSVFSDKPGKCPKCGMQLVLVSEQMKNEMKDDTANKSMAISGYTCPMHPQVHSDTMGVCPICGMQLEKVKPADESRAVSLNTLLKPVNKQVIAAVSMVHMQRREEEMELTSYGFITYDTRHVGVIAADISGRIEKLYVKYRFQKINKGQKIMDIYSPELLTAQQDILFLVKNDPDNKSLVEAAKQKLLLLGMSTAQLNNVLKTGKPAFSVSVYSKYAGHIHESGAGNMTISNSPGAMKDITLVTQELSVKEGMYVNKGQNIFSVFNPGHAWALLNVFAGQVAVVKKGDRVRITPETDPAKDFRGAIDYIEPFYRNDSKTLTARVYFDNSRMNIPIGSQVSATIFAGDRNAYWLPEEAVLSLGLEKVVFVREGESFTARKIETGIISKHLVQVLGGLATTEAVAANAQYLVDSESFIKTN